MSTVLPLPQQLHNEDSLKDAADVLSLLNQSFMQPCYFGALYAQKNANQQGLATRICDHVVLMDDTLLLLMDDVIAVNHEQGLTKSKIQTARTASLTYAHETLVAAEQYLADTSASLYLDADSQVPFELSSQPKVFFIYVTAIYVHNAQKSLKVTHHYGSTYLKNHGNLVVNDSSKPASVMQAFSISNLAAVVDTLANMPDVAHFLDCHKAHVMSGSVFENELEVLEDFIATGEVLVASRDLETRLLASGLRQGIDPKLTLSDSDEQTQQFLTMRHNAEFWNQLIEMYASQVPAAYLQESSSYRTLLLALMNESVYSRNNLVKAIADFQRADTQTQHEGYIMHLRSYAQERRHYALLFYSNDERHPNHRSVAKNRLKQLASQVNLSVQEPHLHEIIVIGMESTGAGFGVDMYYAPGEAVDPALRAQIIDTAHAQSRAQQQLRGHSPVDFSQANNMQTQHNHAAEKNGGVRPILEKNAAAQRYADMQKAHQNKHTTPQPIHKRTGIKRLNIQKAQPQINAAGISSRNALCPCGSGKKFRHCHGAEINYSA